MSFVMQVRRGNVPIGQICQISKNLVNLLMENLLNLRDLANHRAGLPDLNNLVNLLV